MAKKILFDAQARKHLKAGMDLLSNAVGTTLGSRGRYVVIGRKHDYPLITRHGEDVARHFSLKGRFAEMGVNLLRRAAIRTGKEVGDGTSTAIVLTQVIIHEGMKNLVAGAHPMDLKKGLDMAIERSVKYLKQMGKPVQLGSCEIESVATLAANQDMEVGKAVAEAVRMTGINGLITIEEGQMRESHIDMKKGMQFNRGFISPFFITDMANMEAELEHPYVLIYDRKISEIRDLLPILNQCASKGSSLLIMAEGVDEQPLTTLVLNKIRGSLKVVAVKSPGFGDQRRDLLEDAAAFTGGTVLSSEKGNLLKYASLETLGKVDKAIITRDHTALMMDHQNKHERVTSRISDIQYRLKQQPALAEKKILEERLARLRGVAAVLRIGANTGMELRERKARAENALKAAKAALEEGILPGGGVAFLRAQQSLQQIKSMNADQQTGIGIVQKALEQPLRVIVKNAGQQPSTIVQQVRDKSENWGFNTQSLQYEDMIRAGILDPVKVARIALETAASIAGTFLTLECAIAEDIQHSRSRG